MNRKLLVALAACGLIGAGIGGGYWIAVQRLTPERRAQAEAAPPPGKRVLYWHDPMNPQQKFDKPGKSPFMDMALVPVYAEAGEDASSVRINSRVVQNLGIRTAEVTRGQLEQKIEAVGTVAFDERAVAVVQARVAGYVEKLFARATLDPVTKGQPLAEILAPEWAAAQEEYLALKRSPQASEALRSAARQRLDLLGMSEGTIAALESGGKVQSRFTLTAPLSGVITELGAREGMAVTPGVMLFRINGLASVWINAEIPEAQSAGLAPGTAIRATVPAYPGESFTGRIAAVLPDVNPVTRTLKARIEVPNEQGRLKPGMFATVDFAPRAKRETLLVPSEAVIRTGQRSVVVVADVARDGQQRFKPLDVVAGAESGGMTEILKGLEPGMKVVVSGQFLIDSESSLRATVTRMQEAPSEAAGKPSGAPK